MRLLNTSSIELETFIRDVPPYAILSHTWGDEEVTFKDLTPVIDPALFQALNLAFQGQSNNPFKHEAKKDKHISSHVKQKKGWDKITKACAHAASEGWEYIWTDTCCIDKNDLSELSEAINSMFRWYQSATICYAYLADVSFPKDGGPNRNAGTFQRSRWFTRGWTLQELLAPKVVEFLDCEWNVIGSRDDWAVEIEKATHIQRQHLTEFRYCCLATKLSWAAKRQTTRIEDQSYSLLGLLGVHMPLIYGEGKHAFIRLQHELIRTYNDESIFVWNTPQGSILPREKIRALRAVGTSKHLTRTPRLIQRLTLTPVSPGWEMRAILQDSDATVLAPSPKCFAGLTGLRIYRHDARFHFEMTNAGLSINAELFKGDESLGYTGMVYLIRLNCSQVPPTHMTRPVASANVLLLRGLHFDSVNRSYDLDNYNSVPTAFTKIAHGSLDWKSVNPEFWASLGRHDILILNEAAVPSSLTLDLVATRPIRLWFGEMEWDGSSPHSDSFECQIDAAYTTTKTAMRHWAYWAQTESGSELEDDFTQLVKRYSHSTRQHNNKEDRTGSMVRSYVLEQDEFLICKLSVQMSYSIAYTRGSAEYWLILKWNGIALTCGIFEASMVSFADFLEEPYPNAAPGPFPGTEIRVSTKVETNTGLASLSPDPLNFRVILRGEKVRQGLEGNPSHGHSGNLGRAESLLRDIANRSG